MQAQELLEKARKHMQDRAATYDKPEGERSMGKCVAAFNIVTGRDLTEAEGWLLLQILKDVRQWQRPGFHQDSAGDCDLCGEWSGRLVNGACAPCRDKWSLP